MVLGPDCHVVRIAGDLLLKTVGDRLLDLIPVESDKWGI